MNLSWENVRKLILFGLVGGFVAIVGSFQMFLLVDIFHIDRNISYFVQTVISLQLNFNLNDLLTWGYCRKIGLRGYRTRWAKYHLSRLLTTILCQALFSIMVGWNVQYMIAYITNLVVGMVFNYLSSENFVFKNG